MGFRLLPGIGGTLKPDGWAGVGDMTIGLRQLPGVVLGAGGGSDAADG